MHLRLGARFLVTTLALASGAAAAALAACTDSDSDAAAAPPDAGPASAETGALDAAAPSVCPIARPSAASGRVTSLDTTRGEVATPGVKVCILDRPDIPCVVGGDDGTYEHQCVPEGDVGFLFSKQGFATTLWLRVQTAGIGATVDAFLVTDADNRAFFADAGVTYPRAGTGLVTINDARDRDGMKVSAPGAEGPYYSKDATSIDRDAGSTSGRGLAFLIAPVGPLTIHLEGPDAGACQQVLGGWQSKDNSFTVPVLENTETSVYVTCSP